MPTWSNTKQLLFRLEGQETPVVIYTPSIVPSDDVDPGTRFNGYITDLRVKSKISSLAETPLPEFELGQSKTQKLAIIRDLEYLAPRFNVNVVMRENEGEWVSIFEFPIHSRKPFFITEVLGYLTRNPAYAIAPNVELGLVFEDVGYGYPQYNDQIVLYGLVREEYSLPDPPIIIQSVLPATPSEDIDMATLTPIEPVINLESIAYWPDNPDILEQYGYPNGKTARLLVWPALKLARLDFYIGVDGTQLTGDDPIFSWDNQYAASSKVSPFFAVARVFTDPIVPQYWCEVKGNKVYFRQHDGSNSGSYSFQYSIQTIMGSHTFSIA